MIQTNKRCGFISLLVLIAILLGLAVGTEKDRGEFSCKGEGERNEDNEGESKDATQLASVVQSPLAQTTRQSYWSTDPSVNNPVETTDDDVQSHYLAYDGQGGWFVTWCNSDDYCIYAQYFNREGQAMWTTNGIPVCNNDTADYSRITLDGTGGVIIAWEDWRNTSGSGEIWAQRLNASGVAQWVANGIPVIDSPPKKDQSVNAKEEKSKSPGRERKSSPRHQKKKHQRDGDYCPWLVSDGRGGAIITSSGGSSIQHVNASGNLLWGGQTPTTPLTYGSSSGQKLIPDGSGGVIIVFENNNDDIAIQHIGSTGTLLWNGGNPVVLTDTKDCSCPRILSDGAGGAVVMWYDETNYYLHAQRVNIKGVPQWTHPNGVQVTTDYDTLSHCLASDEAGGAFITWVHDGDLYAQRIARDGTFSWGYRAPLHLTFTNSISTSYYPPRKTVEDGSGGFITTWVDESSSPYHIMAQRVAGDGTVIWSPGGVVICNAASDTKGCPRIMGNGQGGAVIVWMDERNYSTRDERNYSTDDNGDLYIQGIDAYGVLGDPSGITVISIAPHTGRVGIATTVTITGTKFPPNATVTVGGVTLENVVVVNSTTITGTVPGTFGTGTYDVVVTNPTPPTQSGILCNAFKVTTAVPTLSMWWGLILILLVVVMSLYRLKSSKLKTD